jgi:hypothetical protein
MAGFESLSLRHLVVAVLILDRAVPEHCDLSRQFREDISSKRYLQETLAVVNGQVWAQFSPLRRGTG